MIEFLQQRLSGNDRTSLTPGVVAFFQTDQLLYPFASSASPASCNALWMKTPESPTDAILRDWPFLLNLGAWAVSVIAIIYVL